MSIQQSQSVEVFKQGNQVVVRHTEYISMRNVYIRPPIQLYSAPLQTTNFMLRALPTLALVMKSPNNLQLLHSLNQVISSHQRDQGGGIDMKSLGEVVKKLVEILQSDTSNNNNQNSGGSKNTKGGDPKAVNNGSPHLTQKAISECKQLSDIVARLLQQGSQKGIETSRDMSQLTKLFSLVGDGGSSDLLSEAESLFNQTTNAAGNQGRSLDGKSQLDSLRPDINRALKSGAEGDSSSDSMKSMQNNNLNKNVDPQRKDSPALMTGDKAAKNEASQANSGNKATNNNNAGNQQSNSQANNLPGPMQPPPMMEGGQKQLPPIVLPNTNAGSRSDNKRRKSKKEEREEEEEKEREGKSSFYDESTDSFDEDLDF